MKTKGTIFAIKHFSLHDGPNLRTTVFLKGCPLVCRWCHNPEGIAPAPEIVTDGSRCIGCRECVDACPSGALSLSETGIDRDYERCRNCFQCVDLCPALAHESTGWQTTVEDVMEALKKDISFYDQSGGGVTFSGGEPMAQPDFLISLLKACERLSIHRAVDTSCCVATERLLDIVPYTQLFLCDLKHMDSETHRLHTGVGNELILENIGVLARSGKDVRIRIPLIPGFNDDNNNLRAAAAFISKLYGVRGIDVLPYHQAARSKYSKLRIAYPGATIESTDRQRVSHVVALLERHTALEVSVGG